MSTNLSVSYQVQRPGPRWCGASDGRALCSTSLDLAKTVPFPDQNIGPQKLKDLVISLNLWLWLTYLTSCLFFSVRYPCVSLSWLKVFFHHPPSPTDSAASGSQISLSLWNARKTDICLATYSSQGSSKPYDHVRCWLIASAVLRLSSFEILPPYLFRWMQNSTVKELILRPLRFQWGEVDHVAKIPLGFNSIGISERPGSDRNTSSYSCFRSSFRKAWSWCYFPGSMA